MSKAKEFKAMNIKMPIELYDWIQTQADAEYTSMTMIAVRAISEYKQAKEAFDKIGGIDTIAKFIKAKYGNGKEGGE